MNLGYLLPNITELMLIIKKLKDIRMYYCQSLIINLHGRVTKGSNSSLFSWLPKKPENVDVKHEFRDFLKKSPTKKLDTLNFMSIVYLEES